MTDSRDEALKQLMDDFHASIDADRRLFRVDIRGSIAYTRGLVRIGVLTADEGRVIEEALGEIEGEIESGAYALTRDLEDIHMAVEKRLIEKVGPVGGKLHTGRSRNDQNATDERLYLREVVDDVSGRIRGLPGSVAGAGRTHGGRCLPRVYPPAAGAADPVRPLRAFALLRTPAGPGAPGGLPEADQRHAPRGRGDGGQRLSHRPRVPGRRTGFRRPVAQQHRRGERPRFQRRVPRRLHDTDDPYQPGLRGPGHLVVHGIRVRHAASPAGHGQQHHAAEEEPGRRRTAEGQDRPRRGQPGLPRHRAQGPAPRVQQGHAG